MAIRSGHDMCNGAIEYANLGKMLVEASGGGKYFAWGTCLTLHSWHPELDGQTREIRIDDREVARWAEPYKMRHDRIVFHARKFLREVAWPVVGPTGILP